MDDEDSSGSEQGPGIPPDNNNVVQNQPYDESVEVSDPEEIPSNNPTPRAHEQDFDTHEGAGEDKHSQNLLRIEQPAGGGMVEGGGQSGSSGQSGGSSRSRGKVGQGGDRSGHVGGGEHDGVDGLYDEDEDSDQSESEESEESETAPQLAGLYDPNDFAKLPVSKEIKELFKHITRYKPQIVHLETKLKPFIPEFIPAIGDIDAFLKVSKPDEKSEMLGLTLLDEPRVKQSDPTLLDLTLRTVSKQTTVKPMVVRSIEDPETQIKEMDSWTKNISELHRQKPATNVHYTKNMPDIENLMQEWPSKFQEAVREVSCLPSADLNCDLPAFADIICALMDIPVYKSRVQSLHVFFSLYMEFKNSQHFQSSDHDGPGTDGNIMT